MLRIFTAVFVTIVVIGSAVAQNGQDSLFNLLDNDAKQQPKQKEYVKGTFKATHVINGQSVEAPAKGVLQFVIMHRFNAFNQDGNNIFYNFFGLDAANIRIGLDYGINDRLSVGLGRSSLQKMYDGSFKYKLLRQTENGGMPVTVVWYSDMAIETDNRSTSAEQIAFSSRVSYTNQLLIARKFNKHLSLQLSPTIIHRNQVIAPQVNDVFSVGFSGRYMLTKRTSFNAEYFYLLPGYTANNYANVFSFGWDIETGGHVFQLMFTNSPAMIEPQFIAQNQGSYWKTLRFGFNISRVFNVCNKKKPNKA